MSVQDVYLISTLTPVSVSCIVSMVAHTPDIISFAGEFSFARSSIWKWYVLKHLFAFGSLPSKKEEKDKRNNHLFCVIHQPAASDSNQSQPRYFVFL